MINRKPVRPEKALIRLEELCCRSEQCEGEVRRKLRTWQIGADDTEKIIASLKKRRFIDDSRYAAAFVRDRYRSAKWGRRKIAMELRRKSIDSETAQGAMEEIDEEEYYSILAHIIAVKARPLERPLSYENRVKLFRFGVMRGYESALVSKAVKEL